MLQLDYYVCRIGILVILYFIYVVHVYSFSKTAVVSRVFPILVLDLAELDELDKFIYLHMNNGIECPWIGEMFICIIHGAVCYSWIAKNKK